MYNIVAQLDESLRPAVFSLFLAKYNKVKRPKKVDPKSGKKPNAEKNKPQSVKLNLKRLIRQLHISRPAEVVISLVGKRYRCSSFAYSGHVFE